MGKAVGAGVDVATEIRHHGPQQKDADMQTIEIWPTSVTGGDAVGDGGAFAYLLFSDPANGVEVAVMLHPKAEQAIMDQLTAWAASRLSRPGPTN